ncbi:hypothetical protein BDV97DRAFT_357494 [Delphinella strobiligena]|nr:hypothetical protein BDV97DRAFT_357494 [Delphinella strobiligena]
MPGPPATGNAATGDAKKRRAGQATAGSTAKKKAKGSQARAIQKGDEEDEDDAETVIPKLVAASKGAKRPHNEAFQGSSAKKAMMETMETAAADGDEIDEEKGAGNTKGGGTETYTKQRVRTGYGDESTLSMPGRKKSRTKYLMTDQEEEE